MAFSLAYNNFNALHRVNRVFLASLIVSTALLFFSFVNAKELKSIEYNGGFVATATANVPYNKTFIFQSPDGFDKLYYARGWVRADISTAGTRIYAKVGSSYCDPNYYDVPVAIRDYNMYFDCSNVITTQGTYTAGFQANRTINNVFVEWKFTYMNNPPFSVASIGGTEYSTDEPARVVLQILDNQGNPIINGNCYTTIRDSADNIKTNNQTLNFISGSNGLYYYQFLTSLPVGVYSADSYCDINGTKIYSGDTFHVADWTQDIQEIANKTVEYVLTYASGTEYAIGENGTVAIQFLKIQAGNQQPVNDGNCIISIYYPNMTAFILNQSLTLLPNSVAIYYRYFTVPDMTGLYTTTALCEKSGINMLTSDSFHVGAWTETIGNISNKTSDYNLRFAGGTEYTTNETGTFVIQFMRTIAGNPSPINDADYCNGTLWFPNKTKWLNNKSFVHLNNTNGLYYYNTTTPSEEGVYIIDAICVKGGIIAYDSDTFHIAGWANRIGGNVSYVANVSNVSYVEAVGYVADANTSFFDLRYAGATEYKSGETGHIAFQFLQTVAGSPKPVNDGECNTTIWYPNKTKWLNNVNLTYLNGSNALYYYQFNTPTTEGVYETDVECKKGGIKTYSSSTFHVAVWANQIFNVSDLIVSHNNTIYNFLVQHNSTVHSYLQSMNTTMTNYYLSLNQTAYDIKTTLDEIYSWFASKIAVIS